ncbi:MAG: hypothetical protein AAFQ41_10625 [Cyanobacteria bacterium J06623_7]
MSIIAMKVIVSFTPITGLAGLFLLGTTILKIVTSSQGIKLHQFGFCTKTTWNNSSKIDPFRPGAVSSYALYLNQPIKDYFKPFPSISLTKNTIIPLYQYRFYEDSSLGRELLKYKPGIF